jgi:hypothetical protein
MIQSYTMKKKRLLLFIGLLIGLAGCNQNFLEVAPDVALTEEKLFANPVLAAQFADNAYSSLINDYHRLISYRAAMAQASDEAVSSRQLNEVYTLNKGLFHDHSQLAGTNDIGGVWKQTYEGIRVVNKMLSKIDEVKWTADQSPQRIKGEMHFLRAQFYFELIKRFGGVVLVDKAAGQDDDIDVPRNTYEECVAFIRKDLEEAIKLLPMEMDNANYGRATSGAAMALRARLLLYAASPLHNTANDLTKWRAAADAAKTIMDLKQYTLHPKYEEILTPGGNGTSPEYIWIKVRGARSGTGMINDCLASPGSGGAQGTFNPTQNHVDLYEMNSGVPIGDARSGYDPANPYKNRDPRFYANILYNDVPWQGRRMQMWNGGTDYRENNATYTITRYYCRKMWPEIYVAPWTQTTVINYIFYRYGEVLLNYAEAQNEAVGPDASVYDAVNQIRKRAGMPVLPEGLSRDEMRKRIHNERAVELAFEDQRWYDVMRWKKGKELIAQKIYGMNVERESSGAFKYTKVELGGPFQKIFEEHMHLYPIPRNEIQKSNKLEQNPGW